MRYVKILDSAHGTGAGRFFVLSMTAPPAAAAAHNTRRGLRGSGMSATTVMGASYGMRSGDRRRAVEVIIEDQTGTKREDDESGEPASETQPDGDTYSYGGE